MTSSATAPRGSRVGPAWVQHGSREVAWWHDPGANSGLIQRQFSANATAQQPPSEGKRPRFHRKARVVAGRKPRLGPLMLVDGLKIGGRDHPRVVIPVSAISVVAGAGYAECYTAPETYRLDLRYAE